MAASLKTGSRWKSVVCDTEVIVVRAPDVELTLECGGQPMVPIEEFERLVGHVDVDGAAGAAVGKRYVDEDSALEVLCTKGGAGTLSAGGRVLALKDAKPMPSSD
jgi:hypothetical protein